MNIKKTLAAAALLAITATAAWTANEHPTEDDQKTRAFYEACALGDEAQAAAMLAADTKLATAATPLGQTALHAAAEHGHERVVEKLLAAGAAVDARTENGMTPLHHAARRGHDAVAKLLLSRGAKAETYDRTARSPLHYAVENGHDHLAAVLLTAGAGAKLPLLHKAVLAGTPLETISFKTVMDHANDTERGGAAALHWAAHLGQPAAVKRLLHAGADPNLPDGMGQTALFAALAHKRYDIAQLLLDNGAEPTFYDHLGETPLHLAAKTGDAAAAALLIKHGADVNAAHDAKSRTPMTLETPNPVVTEDGDYSPDSSYWTPLFWAVKNDHADIADMLLKAGADVNARDRHQRTPLFIVEREGSEDMAGRLLAAGADPRAADWQGDTAVPQPKPAAEPKKPLRERLAEILNEK